MGRQQWNDRYTNGWTPEVTASASAGGTVNSAVFDTSLCDSPVVNIRVRDLASNKKLTLKLQDSDSNTTGFVDVAKGVTSDLDPANEVTANGNASYYYAGEKRYVRLVVTSVDASPGAKLDVLFQRHQLHFTPRNTGF